MYSHDHSYHGPTIAPQRPQPAGAHAPTTPIHVIMPGPPSHARRTRLRAIPWLLLAVLAVQVALSARLVWSNTAFVDEATYIYAGHQEIHSIFTNGSFTVPGQNGYYQAYFSGAPVLYPILGAIADSLGGLATARFLSLGFILGATILLYLTTERLYGRRAGTCASASFAILGPTQFLSAFATYDAMALCLMALAAFLAVKSSSESDDKLILFYACLAMVFADATKYAIILFDPVIIGLCVLASVPHRGWPKARRQGYRMLGYAGTLAAALLSVGGHSYIEGLMSTTIARVQGGSSAHDVLLDSWRWVGGIAVIAVIALVLHVICEPRARTWLAVPLTIAIFLAPLDQARIHTVTSLQKHIDFGAWFSAILVGYIMAKVIPASRSRILNVLATLAAAAAMVLVLGRVTSVQARNFYQGWKNSSGAVAALRPWAENGNILAEDYFIYSYYLENEVSFQRWANTWHLDYIDPSAHRELSGPAGYRDAIIHHYFGTVALSYGTTSAIDYQITQDMAAAGGYRRVEHVRYGHLWFDVFHDMRVREGGRT